MEAINLAGSTVGVLAEDGQVIDGRVVQVSTPARLMSVILCEFGLVSQMPDVP